MTAAQFFEADASADAIADRLEAMSLPGMMATAEAMTLAGHGPLVTYSRKVFIPLTELCRDVCHYCTFAKTPGRLKAAYLTLDQVLAIARAGQAAGCREALFTLGDKPELPLSRRAGDALAATRLSPPPSSTCTPLAELVLRADRACCRT